MSHFTDVVEFMTSVEQHVGVKPSLEQVDNNLADLRIKLIVEELSELMDAVYGKQHPISYVGQNFKNQVDALIAQCHDGMIRNPDLVEIADALTDILYVTHGMGATYGINLDKTFEEVHRSNMSKLDENGKPIKREDGKVMKGPNYSPPDIKSVLFA